METLGTSRPSAANFRMIDVGEKRDTHRRAVASGLFFADPATIERIRERTLPKGDVLVLAEVAGIQGAKRAADLLPLCHPLALTSVRVWSEVGTREVRVFCEVRSYGKTGVEMEALSGVNAALLCIYDLTKGIDPVLRLGEIKLELKEGGKSGYWLHPDSEIARAISEPLHGRDPLRSLEGVSAAVMVLSDRCSRGESMDQSGQAACQWLEKRGARVVTSLLLPDDGPAIANGLRSMLEEHGPSLIVTSGGTGLSPRDITPETVIEVARALGGREVPGIGELLRFESARKTPMAWLSRTAAAAISCGNAQTLVVCLPGSPRAVTECLDALEGIVPHALHVARGGDHRRGDVIA